MRPVYLKIYSLGFIVFSAWCGLYNHDIQSMLLCFILVALINGGKNK
jgi:hypothetical protein